jgi:glutamate/tyrosine decarboxylase-like PLP-dependent enzyme
MDIEFLLNLMCELHAKFGRYFDVENSRMRNSIEGNYASILDREVLSEEGSSVNSVFEDLSFYAQGMLKWNHPGALVNVNPPPTLPSVAAASYVSLYNMNGAQDLSCGYLLVTELAVVKMICQLVGIDYKTSGGVFTFGGKSTILHALKHGIQRIDPEAVDYGIKDEIVAFSSTQGHPCHLEVGGWLGIGEKNCLRISTDEQGIINLAELEQEMDRVLSEGKKVALITANGGTTIHMTIDPIQAIVNLRDKMVLKHHLNYTPRVHVDSVIGWVYLFFKKYDFEKNPLELSETAARKIQRQLNRMEEIKYADSFGVDFHKTGFCPYLSSLYMTLDKTEIYAQGKQKPIAYEELEYGNYSPFQYTLELSRPLNGIIAAYTNLKLLGYRGYQKLIGQLYNASECLKNALSKETRFQVINTDNNDSFVTLFIVKKHANAPSFFKLDNLSKEETNNFGLFTYKFYHYLIEQQKNKNCWFTIDYTNNYHTLPNGTKIGTLKAYPMSPYFTNKKATQITKDLKTILTKFDKITNTYKTKETPHKPKQFTTR